MSKELEVRNLQISFKTNNGTVKAVRDISFDLEKGETLCIVGESGSGKSVTAKAIIGILAGNSIVEGGEIIYNGQDLLKYSEKDFDKIRGNKITMIFQDPMSALDPIMKIGKQMTEATLLNGKTNCKSARRDFNRIIRLLKKNMLAAGCPQAEVQAQLKEFEGFVKKGSQLEKSYKMAWEYMESAVMSIEQLQVDIHENDSRKLQAGFKELNEKLEKVYDEFVIRKTDNDRQEQIDALKKRMQEYDGKDAAALREQLERVKALFEEILKAEEPDFFDMGYYVLHEDSSHLCTLPVEEMNRMLYNYISGKFMSGFLKNVAKALEYAEKQVIPEKEKTVEELRRAVAVFEKEKLDRAECEKTAKALTVLVEKSIDQLSLHKNSSAYTFRTTMEKGIRRYFEGVSKNPKELKRVEKETAEREKLVAKNGNAPKVVPPVLVDLKLTQKSLVNALEKLADSYEAELSGTKQSDYDVLAEEMMDKLKALSFAMVNKVTKQMAYDKAIRIMEDVGIKEPRKRFEQYPFEFSGGMRQRIVIAIAIAANPDILICDEPTTALDVTIQAQILELINDVKRKRQISVIFITHDLGVVANMADKVAVMYAGKIVEYGTAEDIFYHPAHPYTWALLASMPDLDTKEKLEAIPGTPPNMIYPPKGDAFAERNQYAMQIDYEKQPPLFRISDTHYAATWLLHPDAPKVDPPKSVTDRIERMKKLEAAANE